MSNSLRELAVIEYGASPKEIRVDYISAFKIFGTGGLVGYAKKFLFQGPLIIVARKGTLDNPIYSAENCWVIDTAYAVMPKEDVNAKWLYYQLANYDLKKLNEATGVPSINRDLLYRIRFPKASLPEQRKIAQILSTADVVIEKTQAAIAKYKAIKQGMLHDLFTRGIDINTSKLRLRYEDAPELYKESKLGWIPKEWEEIPLEELTTQIGDGIHTTPKYSENTDFYFINGNNLSDGEILIGPALCVGEEEFKKHFKELNSRTILYSINGTIGNIAIYKNEKVILGKSACYISCKPNVNLDYIFFILQSFPVFKFYELEMTGSTISNLSLASVRNTPITIPKNGKEQELIAKRIRTINNKLHTEQNYLHKLQQLKAGLMSDLLSGRVKVSESQTEGIKG